LVFLTYVVSLAAGYFIILVNGYYTFGQQRRLGLGHSALTLTITAKQKALCAAQNRFASPQQPDGHRHWCSLQQLGQPSAAGRSAPLVQLVAAWPAGPLVQLATAWPALNSRTVSATGAACNSLASPLQPDGQRRWCSL